MNPKAETPKTASFNRIQLVVDARVDRSAAVDWKALCDRIATAKEPVKTPDGTVFVCEPSRHPMQISMHKPVSPNFLSLVQDGGGVTDALDSYARDGHVMAYSTAVAFMERSPNCYALVKGSNQSPGHQGVVELLKQLIPQERGAHWLSGPIMERGLVDKLRSSKGVTQFGGTIMSGDGSLFGGPEFLNTGLASELRGAGNEIGGELDLEFRLKLRKSSQSRAAQAKLRDLAIKMIPGLDPDKSADAVAEMRDGEFAELKLTPHILSAQFPVIGDDSGVTQFSVLQDELSRVREMMEDRVLKLVEG